MDPRNTEEQKKRTVIRVGTTALAAVIVVLFLLFRPGNGSDLPGILTESGEGYAIYQNGAVYTLRLTDREGNVLRDDGPYEKCPEVRQTGDGLWEVSLQGEAGGASGWAYYFAPENGQISELFYGLFDERGGLVLCAQADRLIVRGVFTEEPFLELTGFSRPLAPVAEPFTDARFSDDGGSVIVSYLAGEELSPVTEAIGLD